MACMYSTKTTFQYIKHVTSKHWCSNLHYIYVFSGQNIARVLKEIWDSQVPLPHVSGDPFWYLSKEVAWVGLMLAKGCILVFVFRCGYLEDGCYRGKVSLQASTCVRLTCPGWHQWLSISVTELIESVWTSCCRIQPWGFDTCMYGF
jgi:hypothetical protein